MSDERDVLKRTDVPVPEPRELHGAKLEVTSEPHGARVVINGEYRGTTPLVVEDLVPGHHQVVGEAGDRRPCSLEFDSTSAHSLLKSDRGFFRKANAYEFWYAVFGLVVGVICVIAGLALFLNGVTGSTSWTARVLGAESKLSDAAPGVVFGILGFFIIYVTRYRVRVFK